MKPEEFIKVLADVTPEDKLEIDVTQTKNTTALNTILVLYHQSKPVQLNNIWQPVISKDTKKESEKLFYDKLINNKELSAILVLLYNEPAKIITQFIEALKLQKKQSGKKLYDLLALEPSLASHLKKWINSEFVKLKNKAPEVYYSFLYHAALKHDNTDAFNEILELFDDKSKLENLKNLKGVAFRNFYANKYNAKFWESFNLIISHYYDRPRILDLIAEKLLEGTSDLERSKIIKEILQIKTPFSKELESHLVNKLAKSEEATVRLTTTRNGTHLELPFAEFEVLSPTPEQRTPESKR